MAQTQQPKVEYQEQAGYNIAIRVDNKTLCGRTQDDLSISAKTKESLTKDDRGATRSIIVGHDVTLKMSAIATTGGKSDTTLTRDDILELSLATGDKAEVQVAYEYEGGDTYIGKAVITNYSESSGADPNNAPTINIDLKLSGEFKKKTK